jgi:hypothetical protein
LRAVCREAGDDGRRCGLGAGSNVDEDVDQSTTRSRRWSSARLREERQQLRRVCGRALPEHAPLGWSRRGFSSGWLRHQSCLCQEMQQFVSRETPACASEWSARSPGPSGGRLSSLRAPIKQSPPLGLCRRGVEAQPVHLTAGRRPARQGVGRRTSDRWLPSAALGLAFRGLRRSACGSARPQCVGRRSGRRVNHDGICDLR